eukprot:1360102-Amorphochlora_amoeboformis.AAC.1
MSDSDKERYAEELKIYQARLKPPQSPPGSRSVDATTAHITWKIHEPYGAKPKRKKGVASLPSLPIPKPTRELPSSAFDAMDETDSFSATCKSLLFTPSESAALPLMPQSLMLPLEGIDDVIDKDFDSSNTWHFDAINTEPDWNGHVHDG